LPIPIHHTGLKVHVHEDATPGESHVVGIPIEVAMATSEVIHRGGEDEDVPRLTKLNMVLGWRQGEPKAVVLEQDDYGVGVKATPVVVAVSDARPGLSGLVEALVPVESISRKDPTKLVRTIFSFKSPYHPGMCLGTTRDHSRAPGAPDGHSKCTLFAFFGPGRAIIRSRAAKPLDSNSDTTTHRSRFVSSGHG
jgi:hypothetical protein